MNKYRIVIVLVGLLLALGAKAQNYDIALGFRGGLSNGVSVKYFLDDNKAFEGIATRRWKGFAATGLIEIHNQLSDIDGLTWFYGGGAHVGFWEASNNFNWFQGKEGNQLVLGFDGILGVDFTIPNAPINFQLDYKPGLNLLGHQGFWADEFAISARFAIK